MQAKDLALPGVKLIALDVYRDNRGCFMETYHQRKFYAIGINDRFIQDNYSESGFGVVRGLHYQLENPQAKLVRCTHGHVYDVVVDIRVGSQTFGQGIGVDLNDPAKVLYIPEGFAHGFMCLSLTAGVAYKCSRLHAPNDEYGILWNDPDLALPWPELTTEPILSPKDLAHPRLSEQNRKHLPFYPNWFEVEVHS